MSPKAIIEPATPEDIGKFSMGQGWPTMRAWVGKVEGEPVGLFGLARGPDGRWYAFFDITDAARPHKKTIVRTGKMLMDEARKMGLRYVYAEPDQDEALAVRWLRSLGFEIDPRSGVLMRWENDMER
jgi:hypothetical protein